MEALALSSCLCQCHRMGKIRVERCGDVELFVVKGRFDDGDTWCLPALAYPHRVVGGDGLYYSVPCGSYLYSNAQFEALTGLLDVYDQHPGDPKSWWFSAEKFAAFAEKAPGITPEFYFQWPGMDPPDPTAEATEWDVPLEPGFSNDELKFLKHLHRMTGEPRWESLKILWAGFRRQAILWLSDHKTLDLGFAKLVPVPYRANWKEAIAVRFSALLSHFKGVKNEERLQETGFYSGLASPKLLALDRDHFYTHWSVELLESKELDRTMQEFEYARASKLGRATYAVRILREISARMTDILRIFSKYVAKITHPPARLDAGNQFGAMTLVPDLRPNVVRSGRGLAESLELCGGDPFQQWNDSEGSQISDFKSQIAIKPPDFLEVDGKIILDSVRGQPKSSNQPQKLIA